MSNRFRLAERSSIDTYPAHKKRARAPHAFLGSMALSAKGYTVVPQSLADSQGRGFRHVHLKEHRGTFRTTGAGSSSAERGGGGEVVFAKGKTLFVGNIDDQGVCGGRT